MRRRRYLAKTHKRVGGFVCERCEQRFSGRDAYDRHLVDYPNEDWCHLAEEVGLVTGPGGWWRLPEAGPLALAPGIAEQGGVPRFPRTTRVRVSPQIDAGRPEPLRGYLEPLGADHEEV